MELLARLRVEHESWVSPSVSGTNLGLPFIYHPEEEPKPIHLYVVVADQFVFFETADKAAEPAWLSWFFLVHRLRELSSPKASPTRVAQARTREESGRRPQRSRPPLGHFLRRLVCAVYE